MEDFLPEGTFVEFEYGILKGSGRIRGLIRASLGIDLLDDIYIVQLDSLNMNMERYPYSSTAIFAKCITKVVKVDEDQLTMQLEHGIIV